MRCHQSVLATTDRALTEVLVQDDASTLYNGPMLFPEGVCERNSPNYGFNRNCWIASRRARGTDVIMFLNQDCYTSQQGWDKVLLDLFDNEPKCGVAGPTLLFPDGRVQSVGGQFDYACQPFHTALGYANPDWTPIATPRLVSWITGAAFAVRRELWNNLGGFRREFEPAYFEDVAFSIDAQIAGWQVWHEPRIRMVHEVGSTGGSPTFGRSAIAFKKLYVDSKIIEPDVR